MDYSLIVGIKHAKAGADADELRNLGGFLPGDAADQPFQVSLPTGDEVGYYIGVIDFLQEWTLKKSVAHCIKTMACAPKPLATVPPKEYGERFVQYFKKKFVASGAVSGGSSATTGSAGPSEASSGAVAGASKGGDEGTSSDFVEISLS